MVNGLDLYRYQIRRELASVLPRARGSTRAPAADVGGVADKAGNVVDQAIARIKAEFPESDTYPTAVIAKMQQALADAIGAVSRVVAYLKTASGRELDDKAKEAWAEWSSLVDDAISALPHKDYVTILMAARQTKNPTVKFPDRNYKRQVLGSLEIVASILRDLARSEIKVEDNEATLAPFRAAGEGIASALGLLKRIARGVGGAGKVAAGWVWDALKGPLFWVALAVLVGALLVKYL